MEEETTPETIETSQPTSEEVSTGTPVEAPLSSSSRFNNNFLIGLASFMAVILLAALAVLFLRPVRYLVLGPPTATSLPPTATRLPTITRQPTATATLAPPPTATPLPGSAFVVPDPFFLNPPLPGANQVVILNDDTSVTAQPDFTSPQWSTSDTIASQLGITVLDPYHATFSYGAVTWKMDVALVPGFYQLYVLDTLYSSSGALDFEVKLGEGALQPVLGQSRVNYWSTRTTPSQDSDLWHSIGIYFLDRQDLLSISTQWNTPEEGEIIAIDRVAIVPLPGSTYNLLAELPRDRPTYIVDDPAAVLTTKQVILDSVSDLAWGGSFQAIVNPDAGTQVVWSLQDPVPVGNVEVMVRIPEINGSAQATYRLLADGIELESTSGSPFVTIQQSASNNQWASLGTWQVPLVFGLQVQLTLEMTAVADTPGDLAVDAVAFMISQ